MSQPPNLESTAAAPDITALIQRLQETDRQLQGITTGEVDAVIGPGGQSYLLQQAQEQLLRSEREQRALAQRLQVEQARLVSAQAVAKIGSWSFEFATGLIDWSQEMHCICGTDPATFRLSLQQIIELAHPDDRAAFAATFNQSIAQRLDGYAEHRLLLPDGTGKFVELRWHVDHDAQGRATRALGTCQDITGRQQAEQALRKSRAQLDMASRLGKIGAWELDLSAARVFWSDEVCAIHQTPFGTSPSAAQAIEFYAPEYREAIRRAVATCSERGTPFDLELEILTAGGERVWVRSLGEAVRNAAGEIRVVQGAFQDLSDRKNSEFAARRLAARLSTTLESLTIGFCTVDFGWRVTYFNAEAERLLARRRDSVLGAVLWETLPQFCGTALEVSLHEAMEQKSAAIVEMQFDGQGSWLRLAIYPSEEGLTIHFRDVTRERAENQQLKLLEASVARMNDMLIIVDVGGANHRMPIVRFVNDAFVRFTGYSREEIVGKTRNLLYGPKTDPLVLEQLARGIRAFEPVHGELASYKKNGEVYWVEVDVVPVAAHGAAFTHFVGVERDVTERRLHGDALLRLNAELEDRVQQRTSELTEARETAERATQSKSQFLATMSHEIRTPMNGVLGLIDVLAQSGLQTPQADVVQLIRSSAEALLGIVDDVLDFSKIEAGKLSLERKPLHLRDVVAKVCGLLEQMARSRRVGLTFDVDPGLAVVFGDELRLRQILINLVGNAIKFSSGLVRTGVVSVRAERVEGTAESMLVEFTVTDNGVGIEDSTLQRLFKPFTQADASTTRRFGGTGLGLAITNMLVQLMGGDVRVSSEPGSGAVFRVRLPFDVANGSLAPSSARSEIPAQIAPLTQRGLCILVAEDNATKREVLRRQLHLLGVAGEMVADGREALRHWRTGNYAVLLTDLRMPEMDGYELVAAIRAEEQAERRTIIIALTANAMPEEEARCLAAGMDAYLVKPVRLARLRAVLEEWLPAGVVGPRPMTEPPLEIGVLIELIGDDPEGVQAILGKFYSTSERTLQQIDQAVAAGNTQLAHDGAHKLKSGALSVGATRLGALCAGLESTAASGRGDDVAVLWPSVLQEIHRVRAYIRSIQT